MFRCTDCDGATKVLQTRNGNEEVIRKIKCKECGRIFFTKETFMKYTEDTYRKEIANGALFKEDAIAIPDRYKKNIKIKLPGVRSDKDVMVQMVSESKPIDWKTFNPYAGYDDSKIGVIPPEV